MPDLERDLATLAAGLDWPDTPDLATPVVARLGTGARAPRRRRRVRVRRRLTVALAAALLALPTAAVAFPDARDEVLEWLGLRDVTVRQQPVPQPTQDPDLGTRLPLQTAARRAGLTPLVPPQLEDAAAYETVGRLSLRGRDGLLLEQRRGALDAPLLEKIVTVSSDVERVSVGGELGLWFARQHAYLWVDPQGGIREARPTRSGPALVWQRGNRLLRLEGRGLTRARALAIATAARPVR